MSGVNPKDYDVDELRRIGGPGRPPMKKRGPGDVYLDEIPKNPTCLALSVYWARYMAAEMGIDGAERALEMYLELGWISPAVKGVMDGTIGLMAESDLSQYRPVDHDADEEVLCGPLSRLFDEHLVSLIYVAKLAGDDIKEFLNSHLSLDARTDVQIIDGFEDRDGRR